MTALRKPSTWLALAATGLVAAFLLLVAPNYRLYLIHTGSMTPTIPVGSAVIDRKGSDVKVGEVITFHRPVDGAIVTHRLIKVLPDGTYVTKGDDNPTPDLGSIPRSAIVGHVVSAPRYVGEWIHFMSRTTLGYLFDACILVGLWFAVPNGKSKKRSPRHRAGSHLVSLVPQESPPPAPDDEPTTVLDLRGLFDRV